MKVQCWGPVWSEKVGGGWWWISNRSGWLLELLTELTNIPNIVHVTHTRTHKPPVRGCGKNGKNAEWLNMYMFGFNICCGGGIKLSFQTCLQVLNRKKSTFAREMWVVPDSWQLTADVWVGDSNYFNKSRNSRQVELSVRTFLTWSFKSEYTCQNHFWCIMSLSCKLNKKNWKKVKLNHFRLTSCTNLVTMVFREWLRGVGA